MANEIPRLRWLHLSDLHTGMATQGWLWPTLKHALFDDLARTIPRIGGCDLVFFSGDLTQKGTKDEFDRLDQILGEIWVEFRKLGVQPKLIAVPGNHDLVRPADALPETIVLKRWWDEPKVRDNFWSDQGQRYRATVENAFLNYNEWSAQIVASGIGLRPDIIGKIPGDASFRFTLPNLSVGIVALNSSWLQISSDDHKGRLDVHINQLLSVTEQDPVRWVSQNDLNFMVTHHPLDWLYPNAQATWNGDIAPPGRYDLHLYGHMHQPDSVTVSQGGGEFRNTLQGASIFGLEQIDSSKTERIHGYSCGIISNADGQKRITIWPRRLRTLRNGARKLQADQDFDLEDDGSYSINYSLKSIYYLTPDNIINDGKNLLLHHSSDSANLFDRIRHHIAPLPEYAGVRAIEQNECVAALQEHRSLWLISEWGMGSDGFLAAVRERMVADARHTYRIDLQKLSESDGIDRVIQREVGCNIQTFCDIIAEGGPSLLILDDIEPGSTLSHANSTAEHYIEEVLPAILQYCPDLWVVLRGRQRPKTHKLPIIELGALDEADTRTFILSHQKGSVELGKPETVRTLFRHTDGVPARLESALRDLEIVTLGELVNTDVDLRHDLIVSADAPLALARAVSEVANSSDSNLSRSYDLLKALSIFPHGEQLNRIRRFNGQHAFYPPHARQLVDHALIEALNPLEVGSSNAGSEGKVLVVPRPVREYVRDQTDPDELRALNGKAARLYFGDRWSSGTIKFSPSYRFDDPLTKVSDIVNANTVIFRLLIDAITVDDTRKISIALEIAKLYIIKLRTGSHFGAIIDFCRELTGLSPQEGFESCSDYIKYEYACSLRMSDGIQAAKSIFLEIRDSPHLSSIRQSLLLSLSLCHVSLKENDEAIKVSHELISIDKHSAHALHAQSTLLELQPDDQEKPRRLEHHELVCRQQGFHTVANNLALTRAALLKGDPPTARKLLLEVIKSSRSKGDSYNLFRAIVQIANLNMSANVRLNNEERSSLIAAYQFLHNERLTKLFDMAHDALWRYFEQEGDVENLFRLFRHSSFIWRIRGAEAKERASWQLLAKQVGDHLTLGLGNNNREIAYFVIRTSNSLTEPT